MWCKAVCGIKAKSPGVHCERFKLTSRLASDAIEGVCSCTCIIGCVGGTTVWMCEDCRGVRISSCWICCFTSGRSASQRKVTIQAKRKLNNTQIKASWVGVTVFGTSMGHVPLSRLFTIKNCVVTAPMAEITVIRNSHRNLLVGLDIPQPKDLSRTTQSK